MRVAFAGTPPFAVAALESLVAAGHDVRLVLTQPDRRAGRGLRLAASAVSQWATQHGLELAKPESLKSVEAVDRIVCARPEVMVVAAYGLLLPARVLAIPTHGCVNIHASLLPRWRGAAPVQRALLAGDPETGVSIMRMDAGLDTGPVLLAKAIAIGARETGGSLMQSLAALGAEAMVEALDRLDRLVPTAQDERLAVHAPKIGKDDARIDWTRSAEEIDRQVRALDPVPGAETSFEDGGLKIWSAYPADLHGHPGQILRAGGGELVVACGRGALMIDRLQRAGGLRMGVAEFLRGSPLTTGAALGARRPAPA